jgi:hypothetical protein
LPNEESHDEGDVQRQGETYDGTPSCDFDQAPDEDGGDSVTNPETDHDEADIADAPAAGHVRLQGLNFALSPERWNL